MESPEEIGVVGAGTMAPGIAIAFAEAGHGVTVVARSRDRASSCVERASDHARFLESNGIGGPHRSVVDRVRASDTFDDLSSADVVIEAVVEDLKIKREVFQRLELSCSRDALLATNTSGLSITELASDLARPERVLGMHFWNPAHLMPIVEVAGGARTAKESMERATILLRDLGKLPVLLHRQVLGFLGTRLQQAVVREAIALVQEGVASADDVDLAARTSFGIRFPVIGPLESADLSGLDVILAIHEYLLPDLDASSGPQPLLRDLANRGRLGMKSGAGFHEWPPDVADRVVRRRDDELVRQLRRMAAEGQIRLPHVRSSSEVVP